ncbi:hypothetical protein V2A60_004780 [Cordyceps javanica]
MTLDMSIIEFLGSVSADSDIRDAAASAQKKMSNYDTESSMREDVFLLVQAVYSKQKDDPTLDAESHRLLEKEYRAFMRMGLGLPPSKRNRFAEIQKRLPELYIAFSKNLSEERGGVWFKPEELHGVPNDVLEALAKGEQSWENAGKLRLTFKYPDLHPTMKYCTVAETRKKMFLANENRCNQNIALLQEAIALRHEAAQLLGYDDHATFVLEDRMAKTPKTVNDFLDDLRKRLIGGAEKELEVLKALKSAESGNAGTNHYYIWDHSYYHTLMLSRDFELDQNKISEYFPLQTCLSGMLNIFEELFGLSFVKVEGEDRDAISETGNGKDIVWHPDVQLFSVWDEAGQDNASDFVGYLYFDLHPRDGKFTHAANYNLQPGYATDDRGGRRYPATALVCNLSGPTARKPSLLKHNEVVTMFHELGHGIHNLVSQTAYSRFHAQLKALSKHWSFLSPEYEEAYMDSTPDGTVARPEENIPDAMIRSIIRTRHVNDSLMNLRSLHFSIFDMMIHQPQSHEEALHLDASKLFNKLRHDLCMMDDLGDTDDYHWANGAATFGHIMGGYDAGLYGYLSSHVYAADMFRTAFGQDPMSREAGRRYRDTVLKPGGSREPMELLKDFLGREPSAEAYYDELGIA